MNKNHHFVLVHGAWQGAWCWEKVVPLLSDAGHQVHTLDLPGSGDDQRPIADISLDSYVGAVTELINSIGEPVVLVGHSMGGAIISQVAEAIPEKIRSLIFLTAFALKDGETLLQYATADKESYAAQNIQVNEEKGIVTVAEDARREAAQTAGNGAIHNRGELERCKIWQRSTLLHRVQRRSGDFAGHAAPTTRQRTGRYERCSARRPRALLLMPRETR